MTASPLELTGLEAILTTLPQWTLSIWYLHLRRAAVGEPLIDMRSFVDGSHTYVGLSGNLLTTCWGYGSGLPEEPGGCGSIPACDDRWHHLAISFDRATARLTVRRDANEEAVWSGAPTVADRLFRRVPPPLLGAHHVGGFERVPEEWLVDSVRVYDVALDAESECLELIGGRLDANGYCQLP